MPMSSDHPTKAGVKERLKHETEEYLTIAAFLAAFLVSLTTYRKLVLAEYHIGYFAYGWALGEALIIAKVILIGQAMHLGERFRGRPLIVSTLWQSFVFGGLSAAFVLAEHVVSALLHHRPVASEFQLSGGQGYEILARIQLMFVVYIPFFAFREVSRELPDGELLRRFFKGPSARDSRSER
jgi:hypothetical protein